MECVKRGHLGKTLATTKSPRKSQIVSDFIVSNSVIIILCFQAKFNFHSITIFDWIWNSDEKIAIFRLTLIRWICKWMRSFRLWCKCYVCVSVRVVQCVCDGAVCVLVSFTSANDWIFVFANDWPSVQHELWISIMFIYAKCVNTQVAMKYIHGPLLFTPVFMLHIPYVVDEVLIKRITGWQRQTKKKH